MSTFKEQMKGFPVWQITVISIMRFSEPLAFTSLFPYVYFMIRDFRIAKDEASISKYAGYLSASFALTQFLFSIQWGKLSERIGRKPVLLTGLFGTSVCMLAFGFSPNYYVALAARSTMGALNGNIAVLRTAIGEKITVRSHQAVAFSTLPLLWNVGSVVGPLIGGSKYLTRPKNSDIYKPKDFDAQESLSKFYDNFLNKHPYALSNIVVCSVLWFGIIVGFLFLEETHYKLKHKRDYGLEIGDKILNKLGFETPARPWNRDKTHRSKRTNDELEQQPLIADATLTANDGSSGSVFIDSDAEEADTTLPPQQIYSSVEGTEDETGSIASVQSVGIMSRRMSSNIVRRYSSNNISNQLTRTISGVSGISLSQIESEINDSSLKDIFTPNVVQTLSANVLMTMHSIVYGEFLPVFLASKLQVDQLKFPVQISGGFGFDSDFIGSLFSTTGICGVFVVGLLFPYLDRTFKGINNFRVTQFVFPVVYFALPFYIFTLHAYNPSFKAGTTQKLLYLNGIIYQTASATAYPQLMLLVHRSAPARHRGFINASALSLTSLARFLAPLTWGILMSYFDKIGHGGFTWWVLGIMALLGLIQSFTMKEYDEDLKDS